METSPFFGASGTASAAPHLTRSAWLRAGAITLVLLLVCLSALPTRPYDRKKLDRATHRHFVERIVAALDLVGVAAGEEDVGRTLIAVTGPVIAARNAVVGPVKPLFDFVGMGQRWGLFLQSGRSAYRLQVEGRTADGRWTLLYQPHEVDRLGLESLLSFRRLRGLYNPGAKGEPRPQFEGFVDYLATRVFAENRALLGLRVRMERLRLGTRDEPTRTLEVAHESERSREDRPS